MNKVSVYILLILIYLGLSKSFAPLSKGTKFITNERVFVNFFQDSPVSVVLIDSFETGFLIKTYFQKYSVIHGFKQPENIIVKTTKEFWQKNKKNLGMSLYRKGDSADSISNIPAPPGSLYVGNRSYGKWKLHGSGKRIWQFHRAYKNFPALFRWGSFRPSQEFSKHLKIFMRNGKAFYGLNEEFGLDGKITKQFYLPQSQGQTTNFNFVEHVKKFFRLQRRQRGKNE